MAFQPEEKRLYDELTWMFNTFATQLAGDLCVCCRTHPQTTKHSRRQRAVAYFLEALTSDCSSSYRPKREFAERLWRVVDALLAGTVNEEARTSLQRAKARIEWLFENPDKFSDANVCKACGETYEGGDHHCTSAAARAKDAAMARDDTIL